MPLLLTRSTNPTLNLSYQMKTHTFKQLCIGDCFDFISGSIYDSFFARCVKLSPRTYGIVGEVDRRDQRRTIYRIGTINCKVYHVFPDVR